MDGNSIHENEVWIEGSGLPEGIAKEIIVEAPSDNWTTPEAGDEVSVHYVGTLRTDGSEFDSSRIRGAPFVFTLGEGQVIKGWDLGVATMKKGEVAKFTLQPEFAYGEHGSPPKIPENAVLVFEVELIGWVSKNDLFRDEGVIKTRLQQGQGWRTPNDGDEVLLSLKSEAPDGSTVEEHGEFEYTLGSGALGPVGKACDKALLDMKRGEEVLLKCAKDYAYGDRTPEGANVTLKLREIFEVVDCSYNKDKSVMKKLVQEGEGYDRPKDGAKTKLSLTAVVADGTPLPGFASKVLEFHSGNGEVCDALECAASEMKKGEKAVVIVKGPSIGEEAQLGVQLSAAKQLEFTVELQDFELVMEHWDMSEDQRIEFATARKEKGSELFKAGRLQLALQRYKQVTEMLSYLDQFTEENKPKARDLKKACELNKAAVQLKLQNYAEAHEACEAALKEDSVNVKAIFRRAQAELGLRNFLESIRDCKRVVELDAQNREARELLKQAQAAQKAEDTKSKGVFSNMCKALGKGPVREPHKDLTKEEFDVPRPMAALEGTEEQEGDEADGDKTAVE